MALEHPRRRGYPPGIGVEAIAHRSSLSTRRGRKTGSAVAFSDEARAPVAGGGPTTGRWRRVSGGGGAETTTAPGGTAHLARRRSAMAASVWCSNSSGGEPRTAERQLRTRTTARSGRRARGEATTQTAGRAVGRVVGTPARGPNSALKACDG
jgi:hypothetical protein